MHSIRRCVCSGHGHHWCRPRACYCHFGFRLRSLHYRLGEHATRIKTVGVGGPAREDGLHQLSRSILDLQLDVLWIRLWAVGQVGASAALAFGVVVYVMQVFFSRWWLLRYSFGPVEWLWRTLMYGRAQPMKSPKAPPEHGYSSASG